MADTDNADRRASAGGLDARWEFNAPRFYDFSLYGESASPAVHRDGWFDTSQTAGAAPALMLPQVSSAGHAAHVTHA